MSDMHNRTFAFVVVVLAFASPSPAEGQCDTSVGTAGADTLIVGTLHFWNAAVSAWIPDSALQVVVCRNGTTLDFTSCNRSTPSWNHLFVNAGNGNDVISVHPGEGEFYWNQHFDTCGLPAGSDMAIGPYLASQYAHFLDLNGQNGLDQIFGSQNGDTISSNASFDMSADGVVDFVCGYGGNDFIRGNDGDSSSDAECLNGGLGSDICLDNIASAPERDRGVSCETPINVNTTSALWCTNFCPATPPDRL